MTIIEGVGDEVIQFVFVLLVIVIAALAWWSTNARPGRYRTLVVMRSRPQHPVTVSIRTRTNLMLTNTPANTSDGASTSDTVAVSTSDAVEETTQDNARVIPLQEMDSIIDADMAMLDNNRLHFYRRIDSFRYAHVGDAPNEDTASREETAPASSEQIREMENIVRAMETRVPRRDYFTRSDVTSRSSIPNNNTDSKDDNKNENVASTASNADAQEQDAQEDAGDKRDADNDAILIKLKYLNDTLKEVDGHLNELLKDFKLRHFSSELSSESRVRLIFNGRVLLDDAATLRACGLHDRAVVHCLVHPKRSSQPVNSDENAGNRELTMDGLQHERSWDLENILMTLVSVALTVVWFFRCEYSNMFTASASVALFGLTVFYSVAIFGLYLSDTFHFDRRPAQPVPAN